MKYNIRVHVRLASKYCDRKYFMGRVVGTRDRDEYLISDIHAQSLALTLLCILP